MGREGADPSGGRTTAAGRDLSCKEHKERKGIRNDRDFGASASRNPSYNHAWIAGWQKAYRQISERELAAKLPRFTANMRNIFHDRVFGVAAKFGELVDSWDVVNESSLDWARYRKSRTGLPVWFSNRYGLMPGDYPLWALLDAKTAFPAWAKLNINDCNICDDFLTQVNELQREGAKIDIVGCQMHVFDTNACARLAQGGSCGNWIDTPQMIQDRLDLMAKTGKPIHVSEITITSPGNDPKSRMIQAVLTRNAYRKWFSHQAMMGITWWNTVDGGGVKGEPLVSGLFTPDMKKKPAYEALDQLINHEWRTTCEVKVEGEGEGRKVRFRGFRGKYRLTWTDELGVERYRYVYLTGDGVRETMKDFWSRKGAIRQADIPNDHLRIVPAVQVYGRVPLAAAKAKTLAEVVKETASAPVALELGAEPVRLDELFPDYRQPEGSDGTEAAYLVFKVVAPRKLKTFLFEKNDWYMTAYVNGRELSAFVGNLDGWTGCPVTLKEGENEIVIKSSAGSAGWAATFAFRDERNELAFKE